MYWSAHWAVYSLSGLGLNILRKQVILEASVHSFRSSVTADAVMGHGTVWHRHIEGEIWESFSTTVSFPKNRHWQQRICILFFSLIPASEDR